MFIISIYIYCIVNMCVYSNGWQGIDTDSRPGLANGDGWFIDGTAVASCLRD